MGRALDFWRVEAFDAEGVLRLSAEMRLPGRVWHEFVVRPEADGTLIQQTATFMPASAIPLRADVPAGVLRTRPRHRVPCVVTAGTGRGANPS